MAARRLIIVLILLLAASVVAASIAPDRTGRLVGVETTTDTTTEETTTEEPPGVPETAKGEIGEEVREHIDASVKDPPTVRAFVGDQLTLTVSADPAREIAILPLGITDFAGTDAPAYFNILLREPGSYPITDGSDPGVVLGTLEVRLPEKRDGDKGDGGSGGPHKGDGPSSEDDPPVPGGEEAIPS